jgi:hypothetical protein
MSTSASNFLSVSRVAAFFLGSVYAGVKMGQLQTAQNKADLALLAEFDLAEAKKPESQRSSFGTVFPPVLSVYSSFIICH